MPCTEPLFSDIAACGSAVESRPGFASIVGLARLADLISMPVKPVLTAATTDDAYATITGAFVFESTKKFAKLETVGDFLEAPGESIGSTGNLGMKYSPKIRVQNNAGTLGWLEKNINLTFVMALTKPGGLKKIYGDMDFPIRIAKVSVPENPTENYIEVTFESMNTAVSYYTGTIPYVAAV